jgi:hypothetical protein
LHSFYCICSSGGNNVVRASCSSATGIAALGEGVSHPGEQLSPAAAAAEEEEEEEEKGKEGR